MSLEVLISASVLRRGSFVTILLQGCRGLIVILCVAVADLHFVFVGLVASFDHLVSNLLCTGY